MTAQSPITMTPEAVKQIKAKTALNADAIGLRLEIATTGCSGNSYKMAHVLEEDLVKDEKFEVDGAMLYIAKIHSWMLFGMEVDYEDGKLSSGFTFNNPNESGRCGCGESFTVDRVDN